MLREYFNIFVVIYFNNILVYLKILKKHINYIKRILDCFKKSN